MRHTVLDPVCGMTVDPATAKTAGKTARHDGVDYFFCGMRCRDRFVADPGKYLHPASSPEPVAAAPSMPQAEGGLFTCPMHPEIRQIGPGACPICGMALEPLDPSQSDDSEYRDMARRLALALPFTLLVVAAAMGAPLGLFPRLVNNHLIGPFQAVLSLPVVLMAGAPFFARGFKGAVSGHANMFTLIGLGVGVSFSESVIALFAPQLFVSGHGMEMGEAPIYFEAACVIVVLMLLGQVLELGARARTGQAIRALLDLSPRVVRRKTATGTEDIPLSELRLNDVFLVRAGEAVGTDGVVIDGQSSVDESLVTGESIPVLKNFGDTVSGGTVNGDGALTVRATRIGADTMLAKIISLVSMAQRSRAPVQNMADKVATWFVPLVIVIALATFAVWAWFGPSIAFALTAAVSVLVIACPCALGLATPMTVMVAVGRGAEAGVLVRSAKSLERFARAQALVIDKTGTLTEGKPQLLTVIPAPDLSEADVLMLAAALEANSAHPLAHAINAAAKARGLTPEPLTNFASVTGLGLSGEVAGHQALLGQSALLEREGVNTDTLTADAERLRRQGATVMFASRGGTLLGLIAVKDPLKSNAINALAELRESGLSVTMATGDAAATAAAIAAEAGLSDVAAGLKPEDKAALVSRLQAEGKIVAFAGDGVNDAPALAAADVAIAMGTGSDAAIETAGLTLPKGDLAALVRARKLAIAARANMSQNLFFAFIYNVLGVPVAAGLLYPFTGWLLSPMIAAAAMSLSSFSVIANALRLRRARL